MVLLEERGRLECDRLTLFIERKSGDSDAVSSDMLPATMKAASGISRILADGNVQVSDAPAAPGGGVNRLFADHLEYEMSTGLLTVTGDEIRPRLESAGGEKMTADRFRLLRPEQKMYADGGCRIGRRVFGDEVFALADGFLQGGEVAHFAVAEFIVQVLGGLCQRLDFLAVEHFVIEPETIHQRFTQVIVGREGSTSNPCVWD